LHFKVVSLGYEDYSSTELDKNALYVEYIFSNQHFRPIARTIFKSS